MKRHSLLFLPLLAVVLWATGCKSGIFLDEVDTTTEVQTGLALPLGSVHVTIGDLLGGAVDSLPALYFDSLDNQGVLCFKFDYDVERDYHQMNLADYVHNTNMKRDLYEQLSVLDPLHTGFISTTAPTPVTIEFPVVIKLNGINNQDNKDYERLDSVRITDAQFSVSTKVENIGLQWNWIDDIALVMTEPFFRRPQGSVIEVYQAGQPGNFGVEMPVGVQDFVLNLMDHDLNPETDQLQYDNVALDSCEMTIRINMTIPAGENLPLNNNAAIRFTMRTQFLAYEAAWGLFRPSKEMHDDGKVSFVELKEESPIMDIISKSCLPFAKPSIRVDVNTKVAAALFIDHGQVYTTSKEQPGDTIFASFNGQNYLTERFGERFLDPFTSAIGDSIILTTLFNQDADKGHLDRLFGKIPDELGYRFRFDVNPMKTPQMRITPETGVHVKATADLPLIFNEGLKLSYSDTLRDLHLDNLSIDSMLNSISMIEDAKQSELKLALGISNSLPVRVKASMICLDENEQVVRDGNEPFQLLEPGELLLDAPKYTMVNGQWTMQEAGQSAYIISLTPDRSEKLSKVRSIVVTLTLDDESLHYAYEQGMFNVRIHRDNGIRIKLGVAANVDAILSLNNTNKYEN